MTAPWAVKLCTSGSCACAPGDKICTANNTCIGSSTCCTSGDCTETGAVCPAPGGTCGCSGGTDAWGKSCGGATGEGSMHVGSSPINVVGTLSTAGESDWFTVTFPDNGNTSYHPKITISGTDVTAGEIVFGVYGTCGGAALSCTDDGSASAVTTWEDSYGGPNPPADPTSWPVTGSHFNVIGLPGNGGTVIVEVYRKSGSATCNAYTLTISD